uniref:C-CAP/cofactor C-like domain-containing protein n=1 Tax=Mandrillus leucophaeus TaxID=9568 RepID=A0A2K5Y1A0_MANLE
MTDMQNLVEKLDRAVGCLEAVCHTSDMHRGYGDSPSKAGTAPYAQAFDSLACPVAEYLKISKEIGGDVQKDAEMVHTGLKLNVNSRQLSDLLAPISEQIKEVITFREKNRGSKLFNHLSAVSESIQALVWVAMAPNPGPYVKEMNHAAVFYTNRVLKEYKDVDKMHVDWVKAYIKEFHTTGLAWSKTGPVAKELSGLPSGPSAGSATPPPPPGPPPPLVSISSGSDESTSLSALFAQINQGKSITNALKHVSDDMKTHKNPTLKAQSGPVCSVPKPFSKEPAVLELEGKKQTVENQENVSNLLKHAAYIYKCVNTTLQIKGKINSITVDNCKKFGLVFDDIVGGGLLPTSRDVMSKVPTISINKTDGCHAYLWKNSLDCEIVSAKSSEMNVLIPTIGSDFCEFPVPEQFKTLWNGQKLVTTVTEIAG